METNTQDLIIQIEEQIQNSKVLDVMGSEKIETNAKELDIEPNVLLQIETIHQTIYLAINGDCKMVLFNVTGKSITLYARTIFTSLPEMIQSINQFLEDSEKGLEKLQRTRNKLATQFSTPVRMFLQTTGRVTLVDPNTDLVLIDKITPSNIDYQKAAKKFMINRHRLKAQQVKERKNSSKLKKKS